MKTPTIGLIAVLGATALLAAGCGSSKSSSTTAASAYPTASTPTTGTSANTPTTGTSAASSPTTGTSAASTTAAGSASGGGTIVTVKHAGKLGSILAAGPKKLTVYLFEADKGPTSSCSGACASAWPPVRTSGSPLASGAAKSSDLGTTMRSDGTTQVTYKGHPLYYFIRDKDSGDAYGEGVDGFGAEWYVLTPSGSKVDNS